VGQDTVRDGGTLPAEPEDVVARVKDRYGKIAQGTASGCCGSAATSCCGPTEMAISLGIGYDDRELAAVPAEANLGLGCGAPIDHLALRAGETVLDLGSGPGLDAFLAARRVGPQGRVIGVDMTPAMLERARAGAASAGLSQVEFREGRLEALPVETASVDAITSNCVINLVPDKAAVFREAARVLKTTGRMVVSDIVLDGRLPERLAQDVLAWVGCVAGALPREAYLGLLREAGFTRVEILKDTDYLASLADAAPEEAQAILDRSGATRAEIEGKVRSVTYRATK
jgi:arsenite methyltransferase